MNDISHIKRTIESYVNANQLEDALRTIEDNLAILGVNTETYSMLGTIYFQKGDIASARTMLKLGCLLDASKLDILFNSAALEYTQGNYTDALKFLTIAKQGCTYPKDMEEINQLIIETVTKMQAGKPSTSIASTSFLDVLITEIIQSSHNSFFDNIDYYATNASSPDITMLPHQQMAMEVHNNITGISTLYEHLADTSSKELLVKLMAYRILGHHKVKLPLNFPDYWAERALVNQLKDEKNKIQINFRNWELHLFDLNSLGYPIQLYLRPTGVQTMFARKQYEHTQVKVTEGDYVIDAGGCYGDTALFFAHHVGENGRVFTFEFIDSNLSIMKKNLSLNEPLSSRIFIVNRPLWEFSNSELYYLDFGPGSRVTSQPTGGKKVHTISIDDFVHDNQIHKVDFIKMDIEGAELSSLKGARNTILAYKPKLAICLYHSTNDFASIIEYILTLGIEYKFYLDHFTIFNEETILYATPIKE